MAPVNGTGNPTPLNPSPNFLTGDPGKGYAQSVLEKYNLPAVKLGKITPFSGGVTPATQVPIGDGAHRYPYFSPFVPSNEELYAGYQSWYAKAGHGLIKSAGLATSTFLNGTIGLIAGIGSAIDQGKFSAFYDNDFSRSLDEWNKSMEDQFPNYYTQKETDAAWYSPDNLLTANFLFDKVIKNLGYSVGAMASGITYAGALRAIGVFSRVASAGGLARTAALTEEAIATVPQLQRGAAVGSAINTAAGEFLSGFNTLSTAQRAIASGLATVGEASFEALQHMNTFRQNLIQEYVTEHGTLPSSEDLDQINRISENAGNTIFGLNTVLLAATNYIQLPKIIGSSYRAERKLFNNAIMQPGEITFDPQLGRYVSTAAASGIPKAFYRAKNLAGLLFSPVEAAEEFSQSAFGFGVDAYYDKARTGKDVNFIDDVFGEGFYRALTTKEGLESALIGGFSGGIFEMRSKVLQRGITGTGGARGVNTNLAVDSFNRNVFSGYLRDSLASVKRGAVLQAERAEAIRRGDILESRDLERDYAHNYLAPRIKYDRFDLVMDDINQYRTLATSPEGLEQLKSQGIIDPDMSAEQVLAHLDNFQEHARNVNLLTQTMNIRYGGQKNNDGTPLFPAATIDKMIYAAAKVADYDRRIPNLSEKLLTLGVNVQPILDSMELQDRPATQAVTDSINQIRNLNQLSELKDELRTDLRDLVELTLRRKQFLQEYDNLKGKTKQELEAKYGTLQPPNSPSPIHVSQQQPDGSTTTLDISPGESYRIKDGYMREGNRITAMPMLQVHDENLLGELRVSLSGQRMTYMETEQLSRLNLAPKLDNDQQQLLAELMANSIGIHLESQRQRLGINDPLPTSLDEMLELINQQDDVQLADLVENGIRQAISQFESIVRHLSNITENGQLASAYLESFRQMEASAGSIATGNPQDEIGLTTAFDSGAKKHISIVFRSSTSESTELRGTGENNDFHRRANKLLNQLDQLKDRGAIRVAVVTRNNQDALGLHGLIGSEVPGTKILATDPDEGVIRLVFIRHQAGKDYFIDVNGQNLGAVGEQPDFNQLVYTTLPNTSLHWRNGEARYITTGKNAADLPTAQKYQQAWKARRNQLLTRTKDYEAFDFLVSRGIAKYIPGELRAVTENLIAIRDLDTPVIVIATQKTSEHNGRALGSVIHNEETLDMPLGRPLLQHGSTLIPLNNRKLTTREKDVARSLVQLISHRPGKQQAPPVVFDYLRSIFYYKKPVQGGVISSNQIWFEKGYLYLGARDQKIPLVDLQQQTIPVLEQFLDQAYISVNNFLLKQKGAHPYNEIIAVNDNGQIQSIQWKSYQHYLLSNSYLTTADDESGISGIRPTAEIPLTTDIQFPGDNSDPYAAAFEQKYVILRNFERSSQPAAENLQDDPVSDKDFQVFVDKNQVSDALLQMIAAKVKNRTQLSLREHAIFQNRTSQINALIAAANPPAPGADTATAQQTYTEPAETSIVRAGAFVLDGVTLNTIKHKNRELAQVAAAFTSSGIVFGEYIHLGKKALTPEHKAAVLELASSQIAAAIMEEQNVINQPETNAVAATQEESTTSETAQPREPSSTSRGSNGNMSVDDIFKNLPPGTGPLDMTGGNYRIVDPRDNITEDLPRFMTYMDNVLPQVPVHIMDQLIRTTSGGYAWGMFKQGAIYLYENAALGTGYHEVFEAVFNMFLSETQKNSLYDEFRSIPGSFTDRETGNSQLYRTASDHQAKEQMAEEFRQYVLTDVLPNPQVRKGFFARLLSFIKRILGIPDTTISRLFKRINQGYYAGMPIPFGTTQQHYSKALGGLNTDFIHKTMQGVTVLIMEELFKSNSSLVSLEERKISLDTLYKKVLDRLQQYYLVQMPQQLLFDHQQAGSSAATLEDAKKTYTDFINSTWLPIKNNWQALAKLNREFLEKFDITFDIDEAVNADREDSDMENRNYNEYDRDILQISARKNASAAVKLLFATLTEVQQLENAQIADATITLPARKLSSLALPQLTNYARVFNKMLYHLAGNTRLETMVEGIKALSQKDSTYIRLLSRLKTTGNYDQLSIDDWKLLLKLQNVFSRQRPAYLIQQTDESGRTYLIGADQNLQTRTLIRGWLNNLKSLAGPGQLFTLNKQNYQVNTEVLKMFPVKSVDEKIAFLEKLGILFNRQMYDGLSPELKRRFNEGTQSLHNQLHQQKDVATVTGRALGVAGPLAKLAEVMVGATGETAEPQHFNVSGDPVQNLILHNYLSIHITDINSSVNKEELLQNLPHLTDGFSTDSLMLENGGPIFDQEGNRRADSLRLAIFEGWTASGRRSIPSNKLTLAQRRLAEFNNNLSGIYHILVAADARTEWALDLQGHHYIPYSDFSNPGALSNKLFRIFSNYLLTEMEMVRNFSSRSQLRNIAKQGDRLRFFEGLLKADKPLLEKLYTQIKTGADDKAWINGLRSPFMAAIQQWIDGQVNDQLQHFLTNRMVLRREEGIYEFEGLDTDFRDREKLSKKLTERDLRQIIAFRTLNYGIQNIEFHKVFFGDPALYQDATKRIKSFLSGREITYHTDTAFNTFAQQQLNKTGENGVPLYPEDPGYHNFRDFLTSATAADLIVVGSPAHDDSIPEALRIEYENANEADAQSWIRLTAYRELLLKAAGRWTQQMDTQFQYEFAYERNRRAAKGTYRYTDPLLQEADEQAMRAGNPHAAVFHVLKPIGTGVKHGAVFTDIFLDKTSMVPLFYRMVEGTTLEHVYLQMHQQDIGYLITASGRKVGIETEHRLYEASGSVNTDPVGSKINVPFKYIGIQVETGTPGHGQVRGSQITKMATMNLMVHGMPRDYDGSLDSWLAFDEKQKLERSPIYRLVAKNKAILDALTQKGYLQVLGKLGIQESPEGFVISDYEKVVAVLRQAVQSRELPDDLRHSIDIDENGQLRYPLEALTNYRSLKSILYSIVDHALLSPRISGGPKVQVSAAMFERNRRQAIYRPGGDIQAKWEKVKDYMILTDAEKATVRLSSSELKFYSRNQPYMEVLLPHWFRRTVPGAAQKNDAEILAFLNKNRSTLLTGIGFRIPTQALNAIERIKVKGFLPQELGDAIVVPSEITVKAGSDFDVDKLNTYLKNFYLDQEGFPHPHKLKYFDTQTDEGLKELFEEFRLHRNISGREQDVETDRVAARLLSSIFDQQVTSDMEFPDRLEDFMLENRGRSIFSLYARYNPKALENEYISTLEKLVTLPINFENLIQPNSSAELKNLRNELLEASGVSREESSGMFSRLLEPMYMSEVRHNFLAGKDGVGIAALQQTNNALNQLAGVVLDHRDFTGKLTTEQLPFVQNMSILLPHSTVEIAGERFVSISGVFDKIGAYISDKISAYINGYVDVAKDPFIIELGATIQVASTYMFLEKIGVPTRDVIFFMSQPIIKDYLRQLEIEGFGSPISPKASAVVAKVKGGYPSKKVRLDPIDTTRLKENIQKRASGQPFTLSENEEQQQILDEFLKYAVMADHLFKLTQGTNYDTASFSDPSLIYRKQRQTTLASEKNLFSSVEKIMKSTFIGIMADRLGDVKNAMGEIFALDKPTVATHLEEILKDYISINEGISEKDYIAVAGRLQASILDFLMQVTGPELNKRITAMMLDQNSVALRLAAFKKEIPSKSDLAGNIVLQLLEPAMGNVSILEPKNVVLTQKPYDAYTYNRYIESMRELRENVHAGPLYRQLVELSLLQSGTRRTPISFTEILPIEDYAPFLVDVLKSPAMEDIIQKYVELHAFQRNFWEDERIVPTVEIRTVGHDENTWAPVMAVPSKLFNNLGIKNRSEYNFIQLHTYYQSREVQYPVVKVRQIGINPATGKFYTPTEQAEMRKNGDFSYLSYKLYQKVRYMDREGNIQDLAYADTNSPRAGAYQVIYKQINAWGKPGQVQEYYDNPRPSVLPSNHKVTEFADHQIVKAFLDNQIFQQQHYEQITPSKAGKETMSKVENFLEKIGVKVERVKNIQVNGQPIEANGLADITRKLIQVVDGKIDTTLPEEAMHFVVELLEQRNPVLLEKLMRRVNQFNVLAEIFSTYAGNSYYEKNGKPDVRKLKKEAIARILTETIIRKNEGITEKPELLAAAKSWWNRILDWFKQLFGLAGFNPFDEAVNWIDTVDYTGERVASLGEESGELYLQAVTESHQQKLTDRILNIHRQISKETDANNPTESYYVIAGRKIKNRVTNLAKKYYDSKFRNKQINENELQKSLNEQKREKGTDGHADIEEIFHRYVDENGFLRTDPVEQTSPSRLDPHNNTYYQTLDQHLSQRLRRFKAGTRFFAEVMIYDKEKDEAGTIDLLAIEPDEGNAAGKVHILDWKFISLSQDARDIPWYKKEAWNIQISEYERILRTPDYGVAKGGFGLTRAIPIKATYTFDKLHKNRLQLFNLEIGNSNVKLITDDTLLPVPSKGESSGNAKLDELIFTLNNIVDKIYETRSEPGKEYLKNDRLNDLVTAIRRLHLKSEFSDLFEFSKADIKRLNNFHTHYQAILDSGNQELIDNIDINELSAQILDADDVLSLYREMGKTFRKILDPTVAESKPHLREAEIIADGAEIVHDKLITLADRLRTDPIARGAGVSDILTPEKSVTWYQKWVRSLSQGATKATALLWNIVHGVNTRAQLAFTEENELLKQLEKTVSQWMHQQGKKFSDLEDMFLAKDSKGRWNGKVITKTAQAFYGELEKAKLAHDHVWIEGNVDLRAYRNWYMQELDNLKKSYATSRLKENDQQDQELKQKRLEQFEKQFDIDKHPQSAISVANLRLNSYPNLDIWKSRQFALLLEPQNQPVLELYRYWEARLDKSYQMGMIKAWERKTFFPNVRKDFLDKMVFGGRDKQYKTANLGFLNSIRIDVNDAVYGYTDINGNPQDKLSALYVYDLGEKVTDKDGEEFTDYSNKSTDLFKVMALWNAQMAKFEHKSAVVDIVRLLHFTEKHRKAIGRSKKTGGMAVKSDGTPVLIDNIENTEYFKNFMDYYFYGKRLSEGQDVTFTFHYNQLASKVNKFFGSQLMPPASDDEITLSGKKMIGAFNRFFQMKVLGLNLATAVTNYLGGKANAFMLAGRHFTKKDLSKAALQVASGAFHTKEGKVYAGLMRYFLPLTDDRSREHINSLSISKTVKLLSSDHLFYLMRTSDKMVQYPVAIAYFDNTMVEDGQLVNIRQYVQQQYGYDRIYRLPAGEQRQLREKIEEQIEELKRSRSLPVISRIENDKIVIDSLDGSTRHIAGLRNQIQQFSKDALGNMSEDDISQYRMTLLGQSFMLFKNWIPRMADVRFSEFRYQPGTDRYEWGRISMLFNALRQGVVTGAGAALDTLVGRKDSLAGIALRVYAQKKAAIESTGETMRMTEAEFVDMYIKGIRTQLKEVALMTSMLATLLFAKSQSPDDDDRTKGAYRWMVRVLDKLTDELGFFMNPLSFTAIANGSVFPSVQVLNDLVMLVKNMTLESYYFVLDDQKGLEGNKVSKYLFKTLPVTKELMMYTAIFNEELAKEYGISISQNARRR